MHRISVRVVDKESTQLKRSSWGTFIKDVRQFWAILDLPTHVRCFLYYAYYLSPIFAEMPTYPKIGRPLWTLLLSNQRWSSNVTWEESDSILPTSSVVAASQKIGASFAWAQGPWGELNLVLVFMAGAPPARRARPSQVRPLIMAAHWRCRCRRLLFSKIEVRPRSCWSYRILRPCMVCSMYQFHDSSFLPIFNRKYIVRFSFV